MKTLNYMLASLGICLLLTSCTKHLKPTVDTAVKINGYAYINTTNNPPSKSSLLYVPYEKAYSMLGTPLKQTNQLVQVNGKTYYIGEVVSYLKDKYMIKLTFIGNVSYIIQYICNTPITASEIEELSTQNAGSDSWKPIPGMLKIARSASGINRVINPTATVITFTAKERNGLYFSPRPTWKPDAVPKLKFQKK